MPLLHKFLIIALLTILFVAKAKSQTDHLEPAMSYFSSRNFSDDYRSKCRKILFQNLNQDFAIRVIVFPSFKEEYLLTIEKQNGKLALIFRQPSRQIWNAPDMVKINIVDKQIIVDTPFTDTMKLVFEKLILKTIYTKETNRCGTDGTEFQFVRFIYGEGQITGCTWNCAKGERMRTLVDIVDLLKKVCEDKSLEKHRNIILDKCSFLLTN